MYKFRHHTFNKGIEVVIPDYIPHEDEYLRDKTITTDATTTGESLLESDDDNYNKDGSGDKES